MSESGIIQIEDRLSELDSGTKQVLKGANLLHPSYLAGLAKLQINKKDPFFVLISVIASLVFLVRSFGCVDGHDGSVIRSGKIVEKEKQLILVGCRLFDKQISAVAIVVVVRLPFTKNAMRDTVLCWLGGACDRAGGK